MNNFLIMKEWEAIGFKWRVLRYRNRMWYVLERDGAHIADSGDYRSLLQMGWYE